MASTAQTGTAPQGMAPRDFADHGTSVEELAREFAAHDAVTSEALIASMVTQAIQQWRLDDATFWQRVKFQARLIRATAAVMQMYPTDEMR